MVAFSSSLMAQTGGIKGVILDEKGQPMAGAAVVVPGTQKYAITENDGTFSISAVQGETLNITYLGYDDLNVSVTAEKNYKLTMTPSAATQLNETVVIGYGTSTKKEITGSVTSVRSEDFDKGAFNDASALLQGKVAGLSITNPNGADPNGSMEILLRGTNTLSAGQGPLVIIDGVSGADLNSINFQEVATIDVLKDGSAAAIYGTRGTNGVIIITTKRAKAGKTSVEYDGQVSVQSVLSRAVPMTAEQFKYTVDNYVPTAAASLYGAETDWFEEVTRTPVSHRHSLAGAGGSENFSHRTTLNVEQNQGLLKNNDAKKYLIKTNIHQEAINGWLTFDYNISYAKRKYNGTRTGIFRQAFFHNPTEPVYDENDTAHGGYYTISSMDYYNPVAMLKERNNNYDVDLVSANTRATLNILPVKGLKWDNFVSWTMKNSRYTDYKTKYYPGEWGLNGSAEIANSRTSDVQYESTLQYANTFGDHSVQAILGYSYEQSVSDSSDMYNYGFDTDWFGVNNIGGGKALLTGNASLSSYKESNRYIAFFGRVMYNYAERYMASVSLRRDGSSRFGANNKWGWFPAVSLGWRISGEDFMADKTWCNDLKLRAGFGVTGNDLNKDLQSVDLLVKGGKFWYNGEYASTYTIDRNVNPDLRWEKKYEYNLGLDFAFLDNRLYGSLDMYYRHTKDLLWNYEVPTPPYQYPTLLANAGQMKSYGVELCISGVPVKTDNWTWTTTPTVAFNRNIITKLSDPSKNFNYDTTYKGTIGGEGVMNMDTQILKEGYPVGAFYGYKFLGFRQSDGSWMYESANGRPASVVTEKDKQIIGYAQPCLTFGWNNTIKWKDLDISVFFRGVAGNKILNVARIVYGPQASTSTNVFMKDISKTNTVYANKSNFTDYYLEDGSYLKLDNLTVGYTFRFKENKYIDNLRVYLTGQNLFTITSYSGMDPEISTSNIDSPGIDYCDFYPSVATVLLGLNLTLF